MQRPFQWINYLLNLIIFGLLVFDFGYRQEETPQLFINVAFLILSVLTLVVILIRNKRKNTGEDRISVYLLSVVLVVVTFVIILDLTSSPWLLFRHIKPILVTGLFLYLVNSLSRAVRDLYLQFLNPALLFVLSFAIVILLGSLLLMLPRATVGQITYIDALFTATSAVSVTGLAVMDTGKDFTFFGQAVILILIQLGGLGILTITSFFAFFFRSGGSFREGIYVKGFLSTETMSNVLGLAARVVSFTLAVELIGAVAIYHYFNPEGISSSVGQRLFFAFFHSVSAFCNAGFSTLSNSLYEAPFRFNYGIHLVIAALVILGGLGFHIIFNFYVYLREAVRQVFLAIRRHRSWVIPPRVITLNTKIVLFTTLLLIVAGTVFFLTVEWDNTLSEHPTFWGKLVTAFFCAMTPRTAGFNTIDTAALTTPSILMVFLLMWIGASPASTGGGIKTSTFAIATLNILAVAREQKKMEIGTREISRYSIDRAFAIISLSLIVIGFAVFFIASFEPEQDLMTVAFECFSAYSTVGLSIGLTAKVGTASKIVLILTMFVGRIGTINILIGMIKKMETTYHQYPEESILIN